MRSFWIKYNYLLLLFGVFLIAECVIQPFGNFPLNDDWSYAKSVLILKDEGRLDIGFWPAMTLASHIYWGFLFVKVFGFSFFILRLSTLVSAVIGLLTLYKLVLRVSNDKIIAFISCLTLLLNPLFLNMSNTFMTDINFLTLILLCAYFAYEFFTTQKLAPFILVFLLSVILVLIRQYGIIVPMAMTFATLFLKHKKRFYFVFAIVLSLFVFILFQAYENYLRSVLPPDASYKFSGNINPTRRIFWDNLYYGITTRYKIVSIHALFYTFPVLVVLLTDSMKYQKRLALFLISVPVFSLIYFLYKDYPLQVGNVFLHAAVGPDTFYETAKGTFSGFPHDYYPNFNSIMIFLKYLLISVSLIIIIFFLKRIRTIKITAFVWRPEIIFLICLFLGYIVVILITESFFDRYQLPVIALSLVLFGFFRKIFQPKYWLSAIPLILLFYVSVLGTRDYFTVNNKKWEAYNFLRFEKKVDPATINGGFEISCWDNGKDSRWRDYLELNNYNYLIQYKWEEGFELLKEYPFQEYFPYKKDTLRIFERKSRP